MPIWLAAASICSALVTSRVSGVTRSSAWLQGRRVPAYTRFAPRARASSTSADPMPRLAPVTRTALSAMLVMMTISFTSQVTGRIPLPRRARSPVPIRVIAGIHRPPEPVTSAPGPDL